MAFTLEIKSKNIFGNENFNFEKLLSDCNMKYGSDNEFYILEEEKINNETAILYNPARIGRGIFFDGSKINKGKITISYNIPTTEAEITDFIKIVGEIGNQWKKVDMYYVEEEREYTVSQLMEEKKRMVDFSLKSLHDFCQNKEYQDYILTLAMWPVTLTDNEVKAFSICNNLEYFEELLHDKQDLDVYYAKPRLYRDKNTGKILASYVLTEECESIFPVQADGFINLDRIEIEESFVQFFIYSENRMEEGLYDYSAFMKYIINMGATYFDKNHINVPSLTKKEIQELIEKIS